MIDGQQLNPCLLNVLVDLFYRHQLGLVCHRVLSVCGLACRLLQACWARSHYKYLMRLFPVMVLPNATQTELGASGGL